MRILAVILMSVLMLGGCATVNVSPSSSKNSDDHKLVSHVGSRAVKLLSLEGGSGSGLILKSTPRGSVILTNMHVCASLMVNPDSARVEYRNRRIKISHYKVSKEHDICAVRVKHDLHKTTKIAKKAPKKYEKLYTAGHPNGIPLVVNHGVTSDRLTIRIMYGWKKCEVDEMSMDCIMNEGHKPDVRDMDSLLVGSLSAPGSSGSGVYNTKGELVGLVFAGRGRTLSYSFNVPYEYLYAFIHDEYRNMKWSKGKSRRNKAISNGKMLPMPHVLGVVR